jgi:hypothetical protein
VAEELVAHGFFTEFDRFELLGGEIVPMMSPALPKWLWGHGENSASFAIGPCTRA